MRFALSLLCLALVLVGACHERPAAVVPGVDGRGVPACPATSETTSASSGPLPRLSVQAAHAKAVTSMAFGSSGWLATASDDGTVRVWDAKQRSLLRTFRAPEASLYPDLAVRWGPAGGLVVSQWNQPLARLDVESGTRTTLDAWKMTTAEYAEERWVGLARENGTPALVLIDPKTEQHRSEPLPAWVRRISAASSANWGVRARLVAGAGAPSGTTARGDLLVRLGDEEQIVHTGGDVVGPFVASESGKFILVAARKGARWSVVTYGATAPHDRKCDLALPEGASVKDVADDGLGRRAAAVVDGRGRDGSRVIVWSLETCKPTWEATADAGADFTRVALGGFESADVAVATKQGTVQLRDMNDGHVRGALGTPLRALHEIEFTTDDELVTAGALEASSWSLGSAERRAHARLPVGVPSARYIAPGPASIAITKRECQGGRIIRASMLAGLDVPTKASKGWPLAAGEHRDFCLPAFDVDDFTVNGSRLLVHGGARYATVSLPDGATQPLEPLQGVVPAKCSRLGLSPDGAWAVARCVDVRGLVVWDARTGRIAKRLALSAKGEPVAETDGYASAFAFARDGSAIAVGDDANVVTFSLPDFASLQHHQLGGAATSLDFGPTRDVLVAGTRNGKTEAFRAGARVWSVATDGGLVDVVRTSPSGHRVASIARDGVVRLHDARTGVLRAALADFEDDEWLITTPGGVFAGTPEAGDRVSFVYEKPLEGFGFERFANRRLPDVVRRRLAGEDVDGTATPVRPPRIAIARDHVADGRATLEVNVTGTARIDSVRAFVEGRPVAAAPVCAREGKVSLTVPLSPGRNHVGVVAFDARGAASNAAVVELAGPERGARVDAWVVAVGVSDYPRLPPSLQLDVADDDARGVSAAFMKRKGTAFADVHATTLVDAEAKPDAIRAALAGLSRMKPDDVAVVFFAGHGFKPSASADMIFATGGVALRPDGKGPTEESARTAGVSWKDIAAALAGARGRVLVMLDACHAGHVVQDLVVPNDALADALVRDGRAGAVVFAAAKGRQLSLEAQSARSLELDDAAIALVSDANRGHGFFTGAFLRAMDDGATDRNKDGALQLSEVIDEVTRRVTAASDGFQTPWVARRQMFGDYALAPLPVAASGAMVRVPAATFQMGTSDSRERFFPVHDAAVAAFEIDVTETTVAAYGACVAAGACTRAATNRPACNGVRADRQDHPVNCVTFAQAESFCQWAGKRLPTEEEWELAARGTDGRTVPWSAGTRDDATGCLRRSKGGPEGDYHTCPVGAFPAGRSPYGVLDMEGNVEEWTTSAWSENYQKPKHASDRVARGGSWNTWFGSVDSRRRELGHLPGDASDRGFRCAR